MTDIKPGMILYVKTSNEPGMVMDVRPVDLKGDPYANNFKGPIVVMRIPKMSHEHGIYQTIETFFAEELESSKERFDREFGDMFAGKKQDVVVLEPVEGDEELPN